MYFDTLISGKILKQFWRVQFLDKSRISVWKWLSHGRFIDKSYRSMMKSFFFKVGFVSYVFLYTLISGKILKQFWHVQFLHKMENLCLERVNPGCFIDK